LNVAIAGLGLIGGSIGLGLRTGGGARLGEAGEAAPPEAGGEPARTPEAGGEPPRSRVRVTGFDPDPKTLAVALEVGAIDEAVCDLELAVADAEIVFACAPIGALEQTVRSALRCAPPGCVVSDVGSTKRTLLASLREEAGAERFVGGHPLAGSEQGGVEHARGDLFAGAAWCLSPMPGSPVPRALVGLIEGLGAHVVEIDADSHDRLMARISHLPHVLANVLMAATAGFGRRERELAAAGPSFRDATRVAGASTAIWTNIYLSNADELSAAIAETIAALEQVQTALQEHDGSGISAWNESARATRAVLACLPRS
jgi:prephenate dehydrogenase